MEVGAVKQAFNNELILLKKNLNQAKIQTINKLTRKAKTLADKKCPEHLKEKLKRKAESAVKEVLVLKKVKTKDIGKFAIIHKGKLEDYLNKPQIDMDKACARLLLHKAIQAKYKSIRSKFQGVSIKDLFMSRQERLKIKKEERDKQKEKAKRKRDKKKAVNSVGDWDVDDIKVEDPNKKSNKVKTLSDDELGSKNDEDDNYNSDNKNFHEGKMEDVHKASDDDSEVDEEESVQDASGDDEDDGSINEDEDGVEEHRKEIFTKPSLIKNNIKSKSQDKLGLKMILDEDRSTKPNDIVLATKLKTIENEIIKKQTKKPKENKNKNLNEKLSERKFKKNTEEVLVKDNKIVDPFFITSSGGNYMSVAEPRRPDEFKEVHRQGNRQQRRAAMFGLPVPKRKPSQDNYRHNNNNYNNEGFDKQNRGFKNNRFNEQDKPRFNKGDNKRFSSTDDKSNFKKQNGFQNNKFNNARGNERTDFKARNFNDTRDNNRNTQEDSKTEKLHPSWEAKKRQSGLLPFQGKKIVFGES